MSSIILVSNISASTSEKEIKDFLSFCGKLSKITLTPGAEGTQSAQVVFEKESAAKTALLLDQTRLGTNEIHVEASGDAGATSTGSTTHHDETSDELEQEDKPKSRIFAEYLAHGYTLSNKVLERGLETDKQYGVSKKFSNFIADFDRRTGASDKVLAVDNKYNISNTASRNAQSAWSGLSSYYEKFTGTPAGSKLHSFYTTGNKQVQDVHQEALRLAGLKQNHEGKYPVEVVGVEQGVTKTHCQCQGQDGTCGCKAGECTCSGCSKAAAPGEKATAPGHSATGAADHVASTTGVDPLASQKQ